MRRTVYLYLAAVGSVALAATVLEVLGPGANGPTAAQILLLVLLLDARFCGTRPALVASVCAILAFWRYFTTPTGFAFGDPNDWAALLAFVTMSIVVGELASRAERRATEAQQSRQEIARLYQELEAAFERASEAEAAKRNEELKAALLDALTHNLRTPLTAIKAAVTALISAHGWSDAADRWRARQRPYLVAYCRWREGEARLASGDRSAAATALSEAHQIAIELGARPLKSEIESLAARARIALATSVPGAPELRAAAGA